MRVKILNNDYDIEGVTRRKVAEATRNNETGGFYILGSELIRLGVKSKLISASFPYYFYEWEVEVCE